MSHYTAVVLEITFIFTYSVECDFAALLILLFTVHINAADPEGAGGGVA